MNDELRDELRGYLRRELATGFAVRDEIIDNASCVFDDDGESIDEAVLAPLFDEVAAEYEAEKAAWPEVTDCDRLDAAFDELNEHGVMARHDWTCCQTCGHGAMHDEYERVRAGNPAPLVRGYAFYHNQDTEGAADGGGMYLAYGALDEGEQPAIDVARKVVDTLTRHGLRVDWDGTIKTRIAVQLDWKRRRRPARWMEEA
ncbi:MAG TPA: hypothetical protein VIV11_10105 [Kofleriaceae bacterium]